MVGIYWPSYRSGCFPFNWEGAQACSMRMRCGISWFMARVLNTKLNLLHTGSVNASAVVVKFSFHGPSFYFWPTVFRCMLASFFCSTFERFTTNTRVPIVCCSASVLVGWCGRCHRSGQKVDKIWQVHTAIKTDTINEGDKRECCNSMSGGFQNGCRLGSIMLCDEKSWGALWV